MSVKLPVVLDPETMKPTSKVLHPLEISLDVCWMPPNEAQMVLPEGETVGVRDWVEIYTASGSAGKFRVTSVQDVYPGQTRVTLAHGIIVLRDAVIKGTGTIHGTVGEIVTEILKHQTTKAGGRFLWQIGTVGYSGETTVKYNDSNLFDVLIDSWEWLPWNMMEFDQSSLPWKLNIIRLSSAPQCEGRFGRNLKTVTITVDDDELCTVAIADDRNKSMKSDTVSQYGEVEKILTIPVGATDPQVDAYFTDYLDKYKVPAVTVSVDALELFSVTGESWDSLIPGRVHRCSLPDYALTIDNKIVRVHYPNLLSDELSARVELANRVRNVASIIAEQQRQQNNTAHAVGGYSRIVTQVSQSHADLYDEYTLFKGTTEETFAQVWIDLRAAEGELELMAKKTDLDGLETEVMILLDALDNKITLKADKIELQGYVTASELSAEIARINNFFSGVSEISVLKATMVNCTNTFLYKNTAMSVKSMDVTTPSGTKTINYVGY